MNTTLASLNVTGDLPLRFAPGIGLGLASLVSVALWAGVAQIVIAIAG